MFDFEVPKSSTSSRYFKPRPGSETIRILEPEISGYGWWEESEGRRKPIRVKDKNEVPPERLSSEDRDFQAKFFIAVKIAHEDQVKIWEITQVTILQQLKELISKKAWKDATSYDITIERTTNNRGFALYKVTPNPPSEVNEILVQEAKDVDLTALFRNENPFK